MGWVQSLEYRVDIYHRQGPSCTHPRAPTCKQSYCGLLMPCQVSPSWISPFILCLALLSFPFNCFCTFLSQKVFLNKTHRSLSFAQHSPQVFSQPIESFSPPHTHTHRVLTSLGQGFLHAAYSPPQARTSPTKQLPDAQPSELQKSHLVKD